VTPWMTLGNWFSPHFLLRPTNLKLL
jgi:hypothetical protein